MQEFLNWTINTIREDKLIGSWLEERKYDWTPLVSKSIERLINKERTVLVLTDDDRDWFLKYILTNINSSSSQRPYLPFYDFKSFVDKTNTLRNENDINLIQDMLNISFPNGYYIWYIGRSSHQNANIAKMFKNSFMWIFDEEIPNSFYLSSREEALDMKLLQMFRLYNKTLSGVLFAQLDVNK
jgi:hypothetical protein